MIPKYIDYFSEQLQISLIKALKRKGNSISIFNQKPTCNTAFRNNKYFKRSRIRSINWEFSRQIINFKF